MPGIMTSGKRENIGILLLGTGPAPPESPPSPQKSDADSANWRADDAGFQPTVPSL